MRSAGARRGRQAPSRAAALAAALLPAFSLSAFSLPGTAHADPSALWNIVHGQCVPDQDAHHDPAPCAHVETGAGGYAVLKDIRGDFQFLLIPTARISGIEDPALLAPGAPNYFAYAWQARSYTEARLGKPQPRDMIILAINSAKGRTQNQLHIHIDCIRADVRQTLLRALPGIGAAWTPIQLAGHPYRALRINDLDSSDPFRVLADTDKQAAADMGDHTLVVAGETWPDGTPGFVLLDDTANLLAANFGSGEELQDHGCTAAVR